MSKDELRVTCLELERLISVELVQMRELARATTIEENSFPSTVQQAWHRALGEDGDGVRALKAHKKRGERIKAMNAELAFRNCATVDVEMKLKTADEQKPGKIPM